MQFKQITVTQVYSPLYVAPTVMMMKLLRDVARQIGRTPSNSIYMYSINFIG